MNAKLRIWGQFVLKKKDATEVFKKQQRDYNVPIRKFMLS